MTRRAAIVAALAIVVSGCGSGTKTAGPPPSGPELLRDSLAAAAGSEGARYELDIAGKIQGTLPKPFQHYGRPQPNFRASGTIGRNGFTAQIRSSIPEIALFTGDEVVAGPRFAFLRYQGTWYGTRRQGLSHVWSELNRLVGPRLLAGAIHGSVAPGTSQDGVDTWALAGRVDPRALVPLARFVAGALPPGDLARIARRSHAIYEVGRDDRLPRRLRVDLVLHRADLPPAVARQLPQVTGAQVSLEVLFTRWGTPPNAMHPVPTKSYDEYLRRTGR